MNPQYIARKKTRRERKRSAQKRARKRNKREEKRFGEKRSILCGSPGRFSRELNVVRPPESVWVSTAVDR